MYWMLFGDSWAYLLSVSFSGIVRKRRAGTTNGHIPQRVSVVVVKALTVDLFVFVSGPARLVTHFCSVTLGGLADKFRPLFMGSLFSGCRRLFSCLHRVFREQWETHEQY